MIANQWMIATALMLSIHMCLGETTISQKENYDKRLQENETNFTNKPLPITTTALPVIPYIFSVDDYDTLQDAESLHQALSIVAYEPQKIDAKKAENISETIETFEKTFQPLSATTQISNERKYYEVPRKQSNTKTNFKKEKEFLKESSSKFEQKTSLLSPNKTREKASDNPWQHNSYHRRKDSLMQSSTSPSFMKNNQKADASLPHNFSLTKQISPEPLNIQRNPNVTSKHNNNTIDQTGSETLKTEVDVTTINKKERKTENGKPIQKKNYYNQLFQPTTIIATSDRVPRPFSLPKESDPVRQLLAYPVRTTSIKHNTPAYLTTYTRQNIAPALSPEEHSAASSIVSSRHNIRPTVSTRSEEFTSSTRPQQFTYSRNLSIRDRTPAYSRTSPKPDPTVAYRSVSRRRNPIFKNTAKQQTELHPNIPVQLSMIPRSTVQVTQQQPLVYSFTSRPEQITGRSASLSTQNKATTRAGILPNAEQVEIYSTVPTRQNHIPEQETTLRYQTIPPRRKVVRNNIFKEETEIYSAAPTKQVTVVRNPVAKQKVIPEEQNLGHPAIVQPTYTSISDESVNQRGETKYNLPVYENNEDKDYSNNDSYNDSNENKSYTNDSDGNDDNDDDDDSKNNSKQYSYSYNERYEEPTDEKLQKSSHAYKVKEEISAESEEESEGIKTDTSRQRITFKKIDPEYDQDQTQYIDLQSSEQDSDYDQVHGQNTQHEIANVKEARHPKGDAGDLIEGADHHHKKHHKPESHDEAEGHSGEDHENEHHVHGDKGHKGYKQFHEHDKAEKGHHDKEGHNHDYDEQEGKNKKHHEEAGFHKEHEKGEEGEKRAAFKEKGNHKKGHSTKGEHVIHKKDEFDKKTEFFDEFHEGGDMDKEGGFHEEHHHKKGGHYKKGHHHEGEHEKKHGEKGKFDKGHHHHEKKGHNEHEGHEQHHHHEEKHGKKGAHEDAKKWSKKN